MSGFFSPKFNKLIPYTPGEQPQDKNYIKLNTNESPFLPSPNVVKAICDENALKLQLYPDPKCHQLKKALAAQHSVSEQNIFVGNGSDEVLSFLFMAYCDNNCGAAFADITYGFYKVFAQLYNIDYTEIALREGFYLKSSDYYNLNKSIFIANPNAPSGLYIPVEQIKSILDNNPKNIVVIDEAYIDFGAQSCKVLLKDYKNLVVVRTFSKSRSLAGARVGYAIADSEIICDLETLKYSTNPYNVSRMAQFAATAATYDNSYYTEMCCKIQCTRERIKQRLLELGCTVTDSKTNFVFMSVNGIGGSDLYLKLKQKGILVRHFNQSSIDKFIRVTIGTDSDMDIFLDQVQQIIEEKQ